MDNNNPTNNITIDPTQLAPQGVSPVTPNILDITPGAASIPVTPTVVPVQDSVLPDHKVIDITPGSLDDFAPIPQTPTAPAPATAEILAAPTDYPTISTTVAPVTASLPPIEIQPTVLPTLGDITLPTATEALAPATLVNESPAAIVPTTPITPAIPVAPMPVTVNPLQEDPNLVQTIS